MPRLAVLAAAAVVVIAGCAATSQVEDLEERVAQLEADAADNPERRTLTAEIVANVYRTRNQTDPPSCIGVDTNHNELTDDSLLGLGQPVEILNSIDEVIAVTEIETANANKIAGKVFIHTKGLNTDLFEESLKDILKQGKKLVQRYQAMRIEKLLEKQAIELATKLPHSMINDARIEWASWNKKTQSVTINLGHGTTSYQAYNDITDVLSHENKFAYGSKMEYYRKADEILVQQY